MALIHALVTFHVTQGKGKEDTGRVKKGESASSPI